MAVIFGGTISTPVSNATAEQLQTEAWSSCGGHTSLGGQDMANLMSYEETACSVCVCFSRKMCHRVHLSGLFVIVDDSEFMSTRAISGYDFTATLLTDSLE